MESIWEPGLGRSRPSTLIDEIENLLKRRLSDAVAKEAALWNSSTPEGMSEDEMHDARCEACAAFDHASEVFSEFDSEPEAFMRRLADAHDVEWEAVRNSMSEAA